MTGKSAFHRTTVRTAATLAVAALGVTVASTAAFATTVTSGYDTSNGTGSIGPSSPGTAITRSQIISRADDWMNADVPYSQTAGWQDSGTGGPYRQDCSGFVSMAWGLTTSMVTSTLPEVSKVTDSNIAGDTNLNPGDALDYTADHVVLFDSWISQSAGTFDYDAEHTYGQVANQTEGSVYDSTLEGYSISDFEALQYDNLAAAPTYLAAGAPSSVVTPSGVIAFYAVRSDGNVWGQEQSAVGGTFGGWVQLTTGGGFVGKPAVVLASNGTMSIYARESNGSVWQGTQAQVGSTFTWTSLGGTSVSSDPSALVLPNGAQAVYATATDGNVWGQAQNTAGGSFSGWQQLTTGGTSAGAPAAVVAQNGTVQLFARSTNGSVSWGSQATQFGTITWTSMGGNSVVGDPTALVQSNGAIAVYAVASDGNVWGQTQSAAGGAFGGWVQLMTGGGATGEPTAILSSAGTPVLYVETTAGGVTGGTQNAGGTFSWVSLGGSIIGSDPSAILAPDNTINVYAAATDGHVWGDGQSAPFSTFTGWQQLN